MALPEGDRVIFIKLVNHQSQIQIGVATMPGSGLVSLALVSQACLAMEVSPHFSCQLEPVMKLYQSGQWQQAQNKDRAQAWFRCRARLAGPARRPHWRPTCSRPQASRYVELALAYKEGLSSSSSSCWWKPRGDIQAQQSNWSGAIASYKAALALKSDRRPAPASGRPLLLRHQRNMARRSARASSC